MAQLLPDVVFRLLDSAANPVSGGTATFYLSGTSTPTPIYSDSGLRTALPNPIRTNSSGLFVNGSNAATAIYIDPSISYRAVFKDADGTVIRDIDPVFSGLSSPLSPYGTRSEMTQLSIAAAQLTVNTSGYSTAGIGGAEYIRTSYATITSVGYPPAAYFRSLDRYMPNGSIDPTNGGYWLINEDVVTPQMFGAVCDGVSDDTAAFQAALDTGIPVSAPPCEFLITDSILLDPGASFEGAGGVAVFTESLTRIHFEPASKKQLFKWRTVPTGYVFAGVKIKGFCVRGFGAGASECLDLPNLYNGDINFFAYAGIDTWIKVQRWLDCDIVGGVQGFSVSGIDFANLGTVPSGISTNIRVEAYISQGATAYVANDNSVTGSTIRGAAESVDCVLDMARGNVLWMDLYTESAPRTDAGAAFKVGKTGASSGNATALYLNLRPGIGYTAATAANCILLDLDSTRFVKVSGYSYSYGALMATTANTQCVDLSDLTTDNMPWLSLATNAIYDMSKLVMTGFYGRTMQTRGDAFFSQYRLAAGDLELFPSDRANVTRRKLFVDSAMDYKLIRRDRWANFSTPIGMLQTSVYSGWTFGGAQLSPGELVAFSTNATGEAALFRSQRHSTDSVLTGVGGTSTSGSPTITNVAGAYAALSVNQWVTCSAGFSASQKRIIAIASDASTITLDTNATSSVAGTVDVATSAHDLVIIAQQGFRTGVASPVGVQTPKFIGERWLDATAKVWYTSTGTTTADWFS